MVVALLAMPRCGWAEEARQILLNSLEPKVSTYIGEQVSEVRPAAGESPNPKQVSQEETEKGRADFLQKGTKGDGTTDLR